MSGRVLIPSGVFDEWRSPLSPEEGLKAGPENSVASLILHT